jgi:segregation and condensation protein B
MNHPLRSRPAVLRPVTPRPLAWRFFSDDVDTPAGQQARDKPLAMLEAALLLADEPLTARRLATLASLADSAEVRRLVAHLRDLYDSDGSAFQVEELAS